MNAGTPRSSGITESTNTDSRKRANTGVAIKGKDGERTPLDSSTAASMGLLSDEIEVERADK